LQLYGMQVVIAALGLNYTIALPLFGNVSLPLLAAFLLLSAYTYTSGLRGTALVAVIKDLLIYITVLAAVIVIPAKLGGYSKIFASIDPKLITLGNSTPDNLGPGFTYVSLAIGSTLALFMYPHAVTGLLSSSSRRVVKRNAMMLPAYSIALALIALLGFAAAAAGVKANPAYAAGFASFGNNFAVPALFLSSFPGWFSGVAFAAIAIGALVPASMMSIACGNLFTRNIYRDFIAPDCTPTQEARVAKMVAFLTKLGALVFVLGLKTSYAIELQLLGGIWIGQTVPSVLLALYVRLNPTGLIAGWATGMAAGTWMAWTLDFKSSTYVLHAFGFAIPCYAALSALVLNLVVALVVGAAVKAAKGMPRDETIAEDYA
jgi:SSS family solute:Na+ symporter